MSDHEEAVRKLLNFYGLGKCECHMPYPMQLPRYIKYDPDCVWHERHIERLEVDIVKLLDAMDDELAECKAELRNYQ